MIELLLLLNYGWNHIVLGLLQTKSDKSLAANPKNKVFRFLFIFVDMFQDGLNINSNSFKHLVGQLQPEWEYLCKNPIWFATSL